MFDAAVPQFLARQVRRVAIRARIGTSPGGVNVEQPFPDSGAVMRPLLCKRGVGLRTDELPVRLIAVQVNSKTGIVHHHALFFLAMPDQSRDWSQVLLGDLHAVFLEQVQEHRQPFFRFGLEGIVKAVHVLEHILGQRRWMGSTGQRQNAGVYGFYNPAVVLNIVVIPTITTESHHVKIPLLHKGPEVVEVELFLWAVQQRNLEAYFFEQRAKIEDPHIGEDLEAPLSDRQGQEHLQFWSGVPSAASSVQNREGRHYRFLLSGKTRENAPQPWVSFLTFIKE